MFDKIGAWLIAIISLALVISLGYVVVNNSNGISNLFKMPERTYFGSKDSGTISERSKFSPIDVVYPKNGDVLLQGGVYTFKWDGGGSTVSLSLQKSSFISKGAVEWSVQNIKNNGYHIFYVPSTLSGSYALFVTDGDKKGYSGRFTIEEKKSSWGWSIYVDPNGLFEFHYPSNPKISEVKQEEVYPQKQYNVIVPDFVRGVSLSSSDRTVKPPKVYVVTYKSNGQDLDSWVSSHIGIKKGYSSQSLRTFNGRRFYKFSSVKQDVSYYHGKPSYKDRKDVPQELYVTVFSDYAFAILIDFGSTGKYTMQPEDIVRTFIAK